MVGPLRKSNIELQERESLAIDTLNRFAINKRPPLWACHPEFVMKTVKRRSWNHLTLKSAIPADTPKFFENPPLRTSIT